MKLKNCPFCGSDQIDIEADESFTVYCLNCNARIDVYRTENYAIKAWNKRFNMKKKKKRKG